MDCSLPGSSVHGILQARILQGGCYSLLQGIFPTPGIKPGSRVLQADSLPTKPPGQPYPEVKDWLKMILLGLPGGPEVKNAPFNAGELGPNAPQSS